MATEAQITRMAAMMLICGVSQTIIDMATAGAVRSKPKKVSKSVLPVDAIDVSFENFWRVYPARDGANPKHPAKLKYIAALKSGEKPENIIAGAIRLAEEWKLRLEREPSKARFIPSAVVWLNQKRWLSTPQQKPVGSETIFDIASNFEQRVKDNEGQSYEQRTYHDE